MAAKVLKWIFGTQQLTGNNVNVQAPLETRSAMETSLSALLSDIVQPLCLQDQEVSHVNLWMCTR